ncbi:MULTISPECIES: AAA family ATPase [Psychrobacter]|uniref:AAA family ATPase n=1 Tax=Psychrobacter TaxID=497 RepID=UPI00146BFE67|nr:MULTISPECIES: AAA family ATPase [Psychrobacter]
MNKTPIIFEVRDNSLDKEGEEGIVYLLRSDWDDFGYKTSFHVMLYRENEYTNIGTIKIGCLNEETYTSGFVDIPQNFSSLSREFVSLGQDIEFYINFKKYLGLENLCLLNDVIYNNQYLNLYDEENKIFSQSLNRFFSISTFEQVKRLLNEESVFKGYELSFIFRKTPMNFSVNKDSKVPSNLHAVIGSNGVGKTRLLDSIVKEFTTDLYSQLESEICEISSSMGFSRLIYISTSIFSKIYGIDNNEEINKKFHYVGFRRQEIVEEKIVNEIYTLDDIRKDTFKTIMNCESRGRLKYLKIFSNNFAFDSKLKILIEEIIEYLDSIFFIGTDEKRAKNDELLERIGELSSGHSIIIYMIFKIVSLVEEKSIVLMDEPETHLHPPLISAFIRSVNDILKKKNALGIVATHSPVVLQEIPSECIWKMYDHKVERPTINTFGENIGVITSEVFRLELDKTGFANFVRNVNIKDLSSIKYFLGSEALFEYYLRDDINEG